MGAFLGIAIAIWILSKVIKQFDGQATLHRIDVANRVEDIYKSKDERREIARRHDCGFNEETGYIDFTEHFDGRPFKK